MYAGIARQRSAYKPALQVVAGHQRAQKIKFFWVHVLIAQLVTVTVNLNMKHLTCLTTSLLFGMQTLLQLIG